MLTTSLLCTSNTINASIVQRFNLEIFCLTRLTISSIFGTFKSQIYLIVLKYIINYIFCQINQLFLHSFITLKNSFFSFVGPIRHPHIQNTLSAPFLYPNRSFYCLIVLKGSLHDSLNRFNHTILDLKQPLINISLRTRSVNLIDEFNIFIFRRVHPLYLLISIKIQLLDTFETFL